MARAAAQPKLTSGDVGFTITDWMTAKSGPRHGHHKLANSDLASTDWVEYIMISQNAQNDLVQILKSTTCFGSWDPQLHTYYYIIDFLASTDSLKFITLPKIIYM